MKEYPILNFPAVQFKARRQKSDIMVWDSLRGKYIVLTSEEWVRQHLISYLITNKGVEKTAIIQEYLVDVQGQPQRADILVVDNGLQPLMLVECKAPEIEIDQSVLDQAVRYNSVVGARYIMLTNGIVHRYFTTDNCIKYTELVQFPVLF